MLETGDNGIFPWPSFPTYVAACATTGAEARPINLTADWQTDFDAMRAAIYPSTRIVNSLQHCRVRPIDSPPMHCWYNGHVG